MCRQWGHAAGIEDAVYTAFFVSPQMLYQICGKDVSIDFLANDMWAMGVVLVFLLVGYSIFGINYEGGADVELKPGELHIDQLDVVIQKQSAWVRL